MSAIREAEGLEDYLDALEERLARSVASHPGVVAAVGNEALAAGGKRLRPLLLFLSTPPGREPSLAAEQDAVVRDALAGGPLDGALVRVAASGALERSREVALDYANRARACLNGQLHRDELESLTHAVVDRER